MDSFVAHLGISLPNALGVVVSTSVLYLAVALVLRVWGRRVTTNASTGTIALITLVGAIAARATLGNSPTLGGGLVAIGSLVLLERAFGRWAPALRGIGRQRRGRRKARVGPAAVVLMVGRDVREAELARAGLTEIGLWSLLRQRGIGHRDDVGLVLLEHRGAVSVLRADQRLERTALRGVRGAEDLPGELFAEH